MRISSQQVPTEAPSFASKAGTMATELVLSVAAGITADRVRASLLSKGNATSAIVGLAAGALIKSAAAGTITVVANLRNGRTATDGLQARLLDAARTGTLDGALTLAARPLQTAVGNRFTNLTFLGASVVTGTALGAAGGLAYSSTDHRTWQDGAGHGLLQIGAATSLGAVGGGIVGGVTGVVLNRLMPTPAAATVNAHQVRTLQLVRTTGVAETLAPSPKTSWAQTIAFTKQITTTTRVGKASLAAMRESQPEVKAFLASLKPGDVLLIGRGSLEKPQGLTTLLPHSPYGHAMLVATATGDGTGTIVHATGMKGVVQQSFDDAITRYLPSRSRPRMALTLVRPTKDPATASVAIDYAMSKIGAPYNYSLGPNGKAMFCSQLVHNAYDHNPAIGAPVFNVLQIDENSAMLDAFQGINSDHALTQISQRSLNGVYQDAAPLAKVGMYLEDAGKTVVGAVRFGAGKVAGWFSPTGGKTIAIDYRSQVPAFVTPSDLNVADGRSLHTLLIDAVK